MRPSLSKGVDFRVAAGTPLGDALRADWAVACLSEELPRADCDPIRLLLFGEALVAFRNSAGKVGVLAEACPHRKVSLALGRNEGGGLRCLLHQWKFGIDGCLLEAPNSDDPTLKDRVAARAYPVTESGGIVWVYLGGDTPPPFRPFGWDVAAPDARSLVAIDLDCNFVKVLEAFVDSSHIALLHVNTLRRSQAVAASLFGGGGSQADTVPKMEWEATDFGFHYASERVATTGGRRVYNTRVTAYAAPYACFVAPAGQAFLATPQDDNHSRLVCIRWETNRPLSQQALFEWTETLGITPSHLAPLGLQSSEPDAGRLGARNTFLQDRAAMRAGTSYSGFHGIIAEDAATMCSIPGISDYDGEHLVPADIGVVKLRQHLWKLATGKRSASQTEGVQMKTRTSDITGFAISGPSPADWRALAPYRRENAEAAAS